MEKEIKDLEKTIQMNKEVNEKKQKYKEMEKKMNKVKENAKCLVPRVQQPTENVRFPVCPDEKTLSIVNETSIRVVASTPSPDQVSTMPSSGPSMLNACSNPKHEKSNSSHCPHHHSSHPLVHLLLHHPSHRPSHHQL